MQLQEKINLQIESADEYLRKNRIMDLFEDLSTAACFKQPENLKEFIVDELKQKQKHGFSTGLFSSIEIRITFNLFDLKRDGWISKEQCKQALLTLAGSQYHQQIIEATEIIDDKVEYARFQRLCDMFIGLKPN